MTVQYNGHDGYYKVKEKLSNGQTLEMRFDACNDNTDEAINYWVSLSIYNKRKHMSINEEKKKSTGTNPIESILVAIKAFNMLEQRVIADAQAYNENINIIVGWVDNRRRDAYNKVLSRKGFTFGTYNNFKVLRKHYKIT